jgi:hypothetical protein
MVAINAWQMSHVTSGAVATAASARRHILGGLSPCSWSSVARECQTVIEVRRHSRDPTTMRSTGWDWGPACPEAALDPLRWHRITVSCQWTVWAGITTLPPIRVLVKR